LKGELPLGVRRRERDELRPLLAKIQAKFREVCSPSASRHWLADSMQMFGHDYTFTYDLLGILQAWYPHRNVNGREGKDEYWISHRANNVTEIVGNYFNYTMQGLDSRGFGTDEMYREAFVDTTEKRVVELRLVPLPVSVLHIHAIQC
jgi:hypothetical protein